MRFPRAPRGYCVRCYRLVRKIESLEAGTYRKRGRYPQINESSKKYHIKEAKTRLLEYEFLEEGVNGYANEFQIETLLHAVVHACPTKPRWIDKGINGCLRCGLNKNAKKWVYLILLDIVENLKYRGVKTSHWKCFS